jgi:ADP-ribosylglycohydrolase
MARLGRKRCRQHVTDATLQTMEHRSGAALDRVRGCLLGGAVGDALGANVEFWTRRDIRERFGDAGVTTYIAGDYPAGSITDDTQMTLFTAEGLIRAAQGMRDGGNRDPASVMRGAYLRWLTTQGAQLDDPDGWLASGFLVHQPVLHARRAPGMTCLSALAGGGLGTTGEPRNDSKGCGGVMRAAPIGVLGDPSQVFDLAVDAAAISHGHPSGYLAAGAFAVIVHDLLREVRLRDAIDHSLQLLDPHDGADETISAIDQACSLAGGGKPSVDELEQLGEGWVAEEALAIALYCALTTTSPTDALVLSVSHSGDSDSTGAICGNLVGAAYGVHELPSNLLEHLEARRLVDDVASDLGTHADRRSRT